MLQSIFPLSLYDIQPSIAHRAHPGPTPLPPSLYPVSHQSTHLLLSVYMTKHHHLNNEDQSVTQDTKYVRIHDGNNLGYAAEISPFFFFILFQNQSVHSTEVNKCPGFPVTTVYVGCRIHS